MEKSFVSIQQTKAHEKRRFFSIFRSKRKQAVCKHKADYDERTQQGQELTESGLVERDSAEDDSNASRSKLRRLFAPWKSLFHVFAKPKRSFGFTKTESAPHEMSITEMLPGNTTHEISNLVEDLANLAMAITLPVDITRKDLKVNIELNAKLTGKEDKETTTKRLVMKETNSKSIVYSGNIRVPSMTTIEDVSKMPFYLLNGNCTESQHKIETVIKPIQDILPEIYDRTMLLSQINLKLNIENTNPNTKNPKELIYTFVQNGFIKKSIDEIKLEDLLDQITQNAVVPYNEHSKVLVNEILNQIVNKVTLKQNSPDFIADFNKELEVQKSLFLERSTSLFLSRDSTFSQISEMDVECIPIPREPFVSSIRPCETPMTLEGTHDSESKIHLMAPTNTPDAFMPSCVVNQTMTSLIDDVFCPQKWANNKAMRDEVQANIDRTLELLETAKNKLLSYLNQPLINERCYEIADSYRTLVAVDPKNRHSSASECKDIIMKLCKDTSKSGVNTKAVNETSSNDEDDFDMYYDGPIFGRISEIVDEPPGCNYNPKWNDLEFKCYSRNTISKVHLNADAGYRYTEDKCVQPEASQFAQDHIEEEESSQGYHNRVEWCPFSNGQEEEKQFLQDILTGIARMSNNVFESDNVVGESNPSKRRSKTIVNASESFAKASYCDPFIISGFSDNDTGNMDAALTKDQSELVDEYRFESLNDCTFMKRYTGASSISKLPLNVVQDDKAIMLRELLNESMHIRDIIISAVGDFVDGEQKDEAANATNDSKVSEDVKYILSMLLQQVDEQSTLNQPEVEPFLLSPKVYQVYPVYFCLIDDYVDVFPAAAGTTSTIAGIAHRGRTKIPKFHARYQQGGRTTVSVKRQCSRSRMLGVFQRTDGLLTNLEKGVTYVSEMCKEIYAMPKHVGFNYYRNQSVDNTLNCDIGIILPTRPSHPKSKKGHFRNSVRNLVQISAVMERKKEKFKKEATDPGDEIVEYIQRCNKIECKYPLSGGGLVAWQKHWVDLLTSPFLCEVNIELGQHLSQVIKRDQIVQMAKKISIPPIINKDENDNKPAKYLKTSKNPKSSKVVLNDLSDLHIYSSEELVKNTNLVGDDVSANIQSTKHINQEVILLNETSSQNLGKDDVSQNIQSTKDINEEVALLTPSYDMDLIQDLHLEKQPDPHQNVESCHPMIAPKKSFKFRNDSFYDPYAASTSYSHRNNMTVIHEDSSRSTMESIEYHEMVTPSIENITLQRCSPGPVADIPRRFASSFDELNYWQNLRVIHKNVFGSRDTFASTSSSEPETPPFGGRGRLPFKFPTVSDINLVQCPDENSLSSVSASSDAKSVDYDADTEIIDNIMPHLKLVYVSQMELNAPEEIADIETNVTTNDQLNPNERSANSKDFENALNRRHKLLLTSSTESSSLSLTSDTSGVEVNL